MHPSMRERGRAIPEHPQLTVPIVERPGVPQNRPLTMMPGRVSFCTNCIDY